MADMVIRDATSADIPSITAIYAVAVRDGLASWEYDSPDETEMRRRYEVIRSAGYPYLVAERNGHIAGYSYASAYRPRPGYPALRSRTRSTWQRTPGAAASHALCSSS